MSFHVPEHGRVTDHPTLSSSSRDGNNGLFFIESPEHGWRLALICSDGTDDPALAATYGLWEHVSVHAYRPIGPPKLLGQKDRRQERTPSWREMAYVKSLLWDAEDVVVQYHPKRSEYSNCHPHVLHLWRPVEIDLPRPPAIFVGPVADPEESVGQ